MASLGRDAFSGGSSLTGGAATQAYSAAQPNPLSHQGKVLLRLMVRRSEKNQNDLAGKLCFTEERDAAAPKSRVAPSERVARQPRPVVCQLLKGSFGSSLRVIR